MADHRATWVRLREVARQRYPDDDMAAETTVRVLFKTEEAASYAADLDARAEEQDVLDMARATTCLRGELREELWTEGSYADGTEEEYVHLDDAGLDDDLDADDLAYLELPTDEEAMESAAEQRALMASFETQRRNESARRLMAAERRAAADDLAAAHQSARQSAYLRNLAADKLRAVAAGRQPREVRVRVEAERRACKGGIVGCRAPTPIPPALLLRRRRHRRRCPTPPAAAAGSTPPPSPGDRQPWPLRPFRRGRL
jgi:hypothetical protein